MANNIFSPDNRVAVDYHAMPHAVFASPQVASVGLTEQETKSRKIPYVTAPYDYNNTAYGSSIEDRDGFVKVLAGGRPVRFLDATLSGLTLPSSSRK